MKVSQLLKLATVVLALGSLPLHTAFANEEAATSEASSQGQELASADGAESSEAQG